jgi:hypothetical protein
LNITGGGHSFEREYYDLARSSFLKYYFQARIGSMDGVFVAYHNTRNFLGFEYIKRTEMETCLYGSSIVAEIFWNSTVKVANYILQYIYKKFGDKPTRLLYATRKGVMDIVAEVMENNEKALDSYTHGSTSHRYLFHVCTETFFNQKPLLHLYAANPSDKLDVLINITESQLDQNEIDDFLAVTLRSK